MNWDLADFALALALVAGLGGGAWLALRRSRSLAYRAGAGLALVASVLLVWSNAAVGLIGAAGNDANALFAGPPVAALAGGILARFRPRGLAIALAAAAALQISIGAVALTAGLGAGGAAWPRDILFATGFFAALWLAAAWLFRKAAGVSDASARA